MNIKVIVATHKKYDMPEDSMYFPLHVGAEGKTNENGKPLDLGYEKDNTGDNISNKNASYCELTGLYWAWKNLDADYIGLVHYRRYFTSVKNSGGRFEKILHQSDLESIFPEVRLVVPRKRRYYIESLYSHYSHTHYAEELDETRKVISRLYPEYLSAFDKCMKQRSGYMFNMMIMDRPLLEQYCTWLFCILSEIETSDLSKRQLSSFQARYIGRISELIFNVWLDYQLNTGVLKQNQIKEFPYKYMEKIDWARKCKSFLKAKLFRKKYEAGF